MDLRKIISSWWKRTSLKLSIEKNSGTWLHYVALLIHLIGKLTSIFPNIRRKHKSKKGHLHFTLRNKLEAKLNLYKQEITRHQDLYGFIKTTHCDALEFTGLLSATGMNINIEAAKDQNGYWHRRPTETSCYPDGSGSTISRDMMLGLFWHLYFNKQKDLAESTFKHLKENNWVMGRGDPSRLILMPSGEATLAEIVYRLGGKSRWWSQNQQQLWPLSNKGFETHLLVLHVLLRGKMLGKIDSSMFKALEHYAKKNPHNPLYNFAYRMYTDGDMDHVAEQLLDESIWPKARLPRRKDRSSDYVLQRDMGDSWLPATSGDLEKEHDGADFIFATWCLLEYLDNGW